MYHPITNTLCYILTSFRSRSSCAWVFPPPPFSLSLCVCVFLSPCVSQSVSHGSYSSPPSTQLSGVTQLQIKVKRELASLSPGASPLLPYNCCSIPFKSKLALLLHPRLFLPPQEPKLLACASLVIFSYCPSGLKGSFILPLLYVIPNFIRLGTLKYFSIQQQKKLKYNKKEPSY